MTTESPDPQALSPDVVFDSDDTITQTISALIGPEEHDAPALWFVLVDVEDRPLPVVVPVDELPDVPDPQTSGQIFEVMGDVLAEHAPGGTVVVALVHPRGGVVSAYERRWYTDLHAAASRAGIGIRALLTVGGRGTTIVRLDDVGMSA